MCASTVVGVLNKQDSTHWPHTAHGLAVNQQLYELCYVLPEETSTEDDTGLRPTAWGATQAKAGKMVFQTVERTHAKALR